MTTRVVSYEQNLFVVAHRALLFVSAVFSVEKIPHGFAAGRVGSLVGLQRVGGFSSVGTFFCAAIRAAIGETGLAWFKFEFFSADYAGFDGIRHGIILRLSLALIFPNHNGSFQSIHIVALRRGLGLSPLHFASSAKA
jgi:hypothetical protein